MNLEKTEELLVPEKNNSSKKWIVIIVAILIVASIGVGAYFLFYSGEKVQKYNFDYATNYNGTVYATLVDNNYSIVTLNGEDSTTIYSSNDKNIISQVFVDSKNIYFVEISNKGYDIASIDKSGNNYKSIVSFTYDEYDSIYRVFLIGEKLVFLTSKELNSDDYQYTIFSVGINGDNLNKLKQITIDLVKEGDALSMTTDGKSVFYVVDSNLYKLDLNNLEEQLVIKVDQNGSYDTLFCNNDKVYFQFSNYMDYMKIDQFNITNGKMETIITVDEMANLCGFNDNSIFYSEIIPKEKNYYKNPEVSYDIYLLNPETKSKSELTSIKLTATELNLDSIVYGDVSTTLKGNNTYYYLLFTQESSYSNKFAYSWYKSDLEGKNVEKISSFIDEY